MGDPPLLSKIPGRDRGPIKGPVKSDGTLFALRDVPAIINLADPTPCIPWSFAGTFVVSVQNPVEVFQHGKRSFHAFLTVHVDSVEGETWEDLELPGRRGGDMKRRFVEQQLRRLSSDILHLEHVRDGVYAKRLRRHNPRYDTAEVRSDRGHVVLPRGLEDRVDVLEGGDDGVFDGAAEAEDVLQRPRCLRQWYDRRRGVVGGGRVGRKSEHVVHDAGRLGDDDFVEAKVYVVARSEDDVRIDVVEGGAGRAGRGRLGGHGDMQLAILCREAPTYIAASRAAASSRRCAAAERMTLLPMLVEDTVCTNICRYFRADKSSRP